MLTIQEAEASAAKARDRDEEIATGNPLLNLQAALGQTPGTPASTAGSTATFAVKRRWDDDLIFKNQASGVNDKPKKGESSTSCPAIHAHPDQNSSMTCFGVTFTASSCSSRSTRQRPSRVADEKVYQVDGGRPASASAVFLKLAASWRLWTVWTHIPCMHTYPVYLCS